MVLHKRKYHSLQSERRARFVNLEAVRGYQRLGRAACLRALTQACAYTLTRRRTGTYRHAQTQTGALAHTGTR